MTTEMSIQDRFSIGEMNKYLLKDASRAVIMRQFDEFQMAQIQGRQIFTHMRQLKMRNLRFSQVAQFSRNFCCHRLWISRHTSCHYDKLWWMRWFFHILDPPAKPLWHIVFKTWRRVSRDKKIAPNVNAKNEVCCIVSNLINETHFGEEKMPQGRHLSNKLPQFVGHVHTACTKPL